MDQARKDLSKYRLEQAKQCIKSAKVMKAPRVKTWGIFHASLCDAAIFSCITAYTQNLVYLALSHILL